MNRSGPFFLNQPASARRTSDLLCDDIFLPTLLPKICEPSIQIIFRFSAGGMRCYRIMPTVMVMAEAEAAQRHIHLVARRLPKQDGKGRARCSFRAFSIAR